MTLELKFGGHASDSKSVHHTLEVTLHFPHVPNLLDVRWMSWSNFIPHCILYIPLSKRNEFNYQRSNCSTIFMGPVCPTGSWTGSSPMSCSMDWSTTVVSTTALSPAVASTTVASTTGSSTAGSSENRLAQEAPLSSLLSCCHLHQFDCWIQADCWMYSSLLSCLHWSWPSSLDSLLGPSLLCLLCLQPSLVLDSSLCLSPDPIVIRFVIVAIIVGYFICFLFTQQHCTSTE